MKTLTPDVVNEILRLYSDEYVSIRHIYQKLHINERIIASIIDRMGARRIKGKRRWKYLCDNSSVGFTVRMKACEWEERLTSQDNKCAICGVSFSDKIKPHLDHNHKTLKIRLFLCFKCNHGLAFVEDKEFIEKALSYLKCVDGDK